MDPDEFYTIGKDMLHAMKDVNVKRDPADDFKQRFLQQELCVCVRAWCMRACVVRAWFVHACVCDARVSVCVNMVYP